MHDQMDSPALSEAEAADVSEEEFPARRSGDRRHNSLGELPPGGDRRRGERREHQPGLIGLVRDVLGNII